MSSLLSRNLNAAPRALAACARGTSSGCCCLGPWPLSLPSTPVKPPTDFSLVWSPSTHSGDRCSHRGRRKRVDESHREPANGGGRKLNGDQWLGHGSVFRPIKIQFEETIKKVGGTKWITALLYFRVCWRVINDGWDFEYRTVALYLMK